MVPPLRRLTFEKRKSKQNASCPTTRCLASARHALTPALLRGPAAKDHPWSSAAIPASMPGCPLRNTCVRPSWLTGRRDQRPPRGGLTAGLVLAGGVHQSELFGLDLWEQARSHWFLCRLQCCEHRLTPVGASLLAIAVVQTQMLLLVPRFCFCSAFDFDLGAPLNHASRTQALRSGHLGMDAEARHRVVG